MKLKKGRWYKLKFNPLNEIIDDKERKGISGNYAIFIRNRLQYIGESGNLIQRINQHSFNLATYFSDKRRDIYFKIRLEKNGERRKVEKKLIMKLNPDGNNTRISFLKTDINDEELIIDREEFIKKRKFIKEWINRKHGLNDREAMILKMRFGLYKERKIYTLDETGKSFGISRERVRQIEGKAIRKLIWSKRKKRLSKGGRLECLDISTRCLNCLKCSGIYTIKELNKFINQYGFERFYLTRNLGPKVLLEIKNLYEKTRNV